MVAHLLVLSRTLTLRAANLSLQANIIIIMKKRAGTHKSVFLSTAYSISSLYLSPQKRDQQDQSSIGSVLARETTATAMEAAAAVTARMFNNLRQFPKQLADRNSQ